VPVPALRVEIVAQSRHYSRAVPGTGTILTGPGRAWTVLFRAVPGLAHRVSAKWSSIVLCHSATGLPLMARLSTERQHPILSMARRETKHSSRDLMSVAHSLYGWNRGRARVVQLITKQETCDSVRRLSLCL
jgi:hypothetical protein